MKNFNYFLIIIAVVIAVFFLSASKRTKDYCSIGAFIADRPTKKAIQQFQADFGKKPYLVMVFVDWENFVDNEVVNDVYSMESVLLVTWEPWYAIKREGINYDTILSGSMDSYIKNFAGELKLINKPVFLRFAHEMNGNWYPWSASKIGARKYIAVYRYIRNIFDELNADNVKWIFSINWEDIPKENSYMKCYPGNDYIDFIGIDGYNWGNSKSWSRWISFKNIFNKRCKEAAAYFKKPIIISEFGSTSSGGDKARWIREAMAEIKNMKEIKGFVLFNVNKETDWSFPIDRDSGKELNLQLKDNYFKDKDCLYD